MPGCHSQVEVTRDFPRQFRLREIDILPLISNTPNSKPLWPGKLRFTTASGPVRGVIKHTQKGKGVPTKLLEQVDLPALKKENKWPLNPSLLPPGPSLPVHPLHWAPCSCSPTKPASWVIFDLTSGPLNLPVPGKPLPILHFYRPAPPFTPVSALLLSVPLYCYKPFITTPCWVWVFLCLFIYGSLIMLACEFQKGRASHSIPSVICM